MKNIITNIISKVFAFIVTIIYVPLVLIHKIFRFFVVQGEIELQERKGKKLAKYHDENVKQAKIDTYLEERKRVRAYEEADLNGMAYYNGEMIFSKEYELECKREEQVRLENESLLKKQATSRKTAQDELNQLYAEDTQEFNVLHAVENKPDKIKRAIDETVRDFRREVGDGNMSNRWKGVYRDILYDDVYKYAEEICGDSRRHNYCSPDGNSFELSYMNKRYMLDFIKLPDNSTAIIVETWSFR